MAHGKLSPSKAHRWLVCPGSQFYDKEGPESSYAEEGSHAHRILELVLDGYPVLAGDTIAGRQATSERIQQAIEIRDWLRQWQEQHPDFIIETETSICVSRAIGYDHERCEDVDGTADVGAYNPTTKEIVVLDAKFGFVRVEAKNNPQLYLYAIGLLWEIITTWGHDKSHFDDWNITVIIAQPDYEGVVQFREHRMRYQELRQWYRDNIIAIGNALRGDKNLNATSEHACRYCPNRVSCPARLEILRQFATEEWRTTRTLGELLPVLAKVRSIADDLEAEAVRLLAEGQPVPGFKLVESRSIRKWVGEDVAIKAAENLGLSIIQPKVMSPAQVEKAYKAQGKALTKEFAVTPRGGPKLVPESDTRPAWEKPEDFTQEEIDSLLKGE